MEKQTVGDLIWWGSQLAAAWLVGESGRILVAGGAGGMLRWMNTEGRRLRDGIIAAIGGAITAYFFWPLTLAGLQWLTKQPLEGADAQAMAGCLTGVLGMSAVKIAVAGFEAWALRQIGGGQAGNG